MDAEEVVDGILETVYKLGKCKRACLNLMDLQIQLRSNLKHGAELPKHTDESDIEYIYRVLCEELDEVFE